MTVAQGTPNLETRMVMTEQQTDALVEHWGIGDVDRCIQNLELERLRLSAQHQGTVERLGKAFEELTRRETRILELSAQVADTDKALEICNEQLDDAQNRFSASAKLSAKLSAQVVELQKELAAKNKPVVFCYSKCAMHRHVPWEMKVTVMTGTVATVCPICHPPEQSV